MAEREPRGQKYPRRHRLGPLAVVPRGQRQGQPELAMGALPEYPGSEPALGQSSVKVLYSSPNFWVHCLGEAVQ